jgi:hypothetical protein
MPDYKALYYRLAGKLADVIDILVEIEQAAEDAVIAEEAAFDMLPEDKTDAC